MTVTLYALEPTAPEGDVREQIRPIYMAYMRQHYGRGEDWPSRGPDVYLGRAAFDAFERALVRLERFIARAPEEDSLWFRQSLVRPRGEGWDMTIETAR